jgi:hypothetical protein
MLRLINTTQILEGTRHMFLQLRFTKIFFIGLFMLCTGLLAHTQEKKEVTKDSLPVAEQKPKINRYDSAIKAHSPRVAAIRSALVPGLGQIYNKKYWKLPIVYGALGITGYIFIDNIKTYKEYRFAYAARFKAAQLPPQRDSTDYFTLKPLYKAISPESIRAARNRFRQYVDYSALFFLIFWGLNVVDATVDAHLKSFDVSPELSLQLRFRAGYSEIARTNGVSFVLKFSK